MSCGICISQLLAVWWPSVLMGLIRPFCSTINCPKYDLLGVSKSRSWVSYETIVRLRKRVRIRNFTFAVLICHSKESSCSSQKTLSSGKRPLCNFVGRANKSLITSFDTHVRAPSLWKDSVVTLDRTSPVTLFHPKKEG